MKYNKELGKKDTPAAGDAVRITVEGKRNYTGTLSIDYLVESTAPKNLKDAKVSKIAVQDYTGKAITPDFNVKINGVTLKKDEDYAIVGYYNNVKKGTAAVLIFGKGSYCGIKSFTFKIGAKKLLLKQVSSANHNINHYVRNENSVFWSAG